MCINVNWESQAVPFYRVTPNEQDLILKNQELCICTSSSSLFQMVAAGQPRCIYLLADLKTDWVASSADMSGNPYSKGFIGTKPFTLHMYMKFSVVPDCGRWTASRCIQ